METLEVVEVEVAQNTFPVLALMRARITHLEGERVFVWERWVVVLAILALYNARHAWGDAIRRMNTARKNAIAEIWS